MAGGRGTRLEPYTTVLPKPLMPLSDRPIIDVILRQLAAAHVARINISVGHLGSLIESWVRQQDDYGVPLSFFYEETPRGTAGSLADMGGLEGAFIAMNGDVLTTLSYEDLIRQHIESQAVATMAVTNRSVDIEYGLVHSDGGGRLVGLDEKPRFDYTVSMGVYVFQAEITRHIGSGERVDVPDLLLRARDAGDLVMTYDFSGYWRDIGNRDDHIAAVEDFSADASRFVASEGSAS